MEWHNTSQAITYLAGIALLGLADYLRTRSFANLVLVRFGRCLFRAFLGFRSDHQKDEKIADLEAIIDDLRETIDIFKAAAVLRSDADLLITPLRPGMVSIDSPLVAPPKKIVSPRSRKPRKNSTGMPGL